MEDIDHSFPSMNILGRLSADIPSTVYGFDTGGSHRADIRTLCVRALFAVIVSITDGALNVGCRPIDDAGCVSMLPLYVVTNIPLLSKISLSGRRTLALRGSGLDRMLLMLLQINLCSTEVDALLAADCAGKYSGFNRVT